jgi:hypothetical protein
MHLTNLELGSFTLTVQVNPLWSVTICNVRPNRQSLKCLQAQTIANNSFSTVKYFDPAVFSVRLVYATGLLKPNFFWLKMAPRICRWNQRFVEICTLQKWVLVNLDLSRSKLICCYHTVPFFNRPVNGLATTLKLTVNFPSYPRMTHGLFVTVVWATQLLSPSFDYLVWLLLLWLHALNNLVLPSRIRTSLAQFLDDTRGVLGKCYVTWNYVPSRFLLVSSYHPGKLNICLELVQIRHNLFKHAQEKVQPKLYTEI